MIKISVIMPVYNAAEFLRESIGDVLKQTFEEFELICIDDGSMDNSRNIIEEFIKEDSRVKFLYQNNAGAGAARNLGMRLAKGKYLLFLDADDRFDSDLLKLTWEQAEEKEAEVLIFAADCFQYGTERIREASWLLNKKYLDTDYTEQSVIRKEKKNQILYQVSTSTVWNKLFKTDFIRENSITFQEIYVVDSMYFVMLAMAYAKRIALFDKTLVHYRENVPTGQLMNHDKSPIGVYEALYSVKEHLQKRNIFDDVKYSFLNYAAKMCLERMSLFSTRKSEEQLYNVLHGGGLERLGFDFESESLQRENIVDWKLCKNVYEKDYVDYLFEQKKKLKQMVNSKGTIYKFPEMLLEGKKRIAIYGAGNIGKSYFCQLMNKQEHQIVGWYDKNYASYGYPIDNPEQLKEKKVDAILIAVQMESVAIEIINKLYDLGVNETKIIWTEPQIL